MSDMIIRPGHVIRAAELLSQILTDLRQPADQRMEAYFRAHKEMGKRDRHVVAELTYGVLRHQRMLEARLGELAQGWPGYQRRVAALLMIQQGMSQRGLEKYIDEAMAKEVAQALREHPTNELAAEVRYSVPDVVWQAWLAELGEASATALAQSLLSPAQVDLRVNRLKSTTDKVQQVLADWGVETSRLPGVPMGLRQQGRRALQSNAAFKQGHFEIQDAGSQLLGALLPIAEGQKVTDFCAGAGGKTLQLAARMNNKGSITACDISEARLNRMRPRLARAGVDNVRIMPIEHEQDKSLKRLRATQDAVLVDAPCSGSGTWRRHPDMKWRSLDLVSLNATQLSVLNAAARLVKEGGYLLYATCSLLSCENEAIVQAFLAENGAFRLLPLTEDALADGTQLPAQAINAQGMLQLRPDVHGMDGFFAALLQKVDAIE